MNKIKNIVLNPYIQAISAWVAVFTILGNWISAVGRKMMTFMPQDLMLFENIMLSLVLTALIFSIHAYLRSGKKQINPIFPPAPLLKGIDIINKFSITPFALFQHVKNGLPAYIQNTKGHDVDLRAISERDLIGCEVWSEESDSIIEQWLFKTEDIEKYIKNT